MPKSSEREYRNMTMEVVRAEEDQEQEEKKVAGYACTFDDPYVLYEDDDIVYREQIDKNAFDDTDMSDVIMQYDHAGRVFARNTNNTLLINPDERGLYTEASLGGTELGRQLYDEIAGGYTDKMSFGFTVESDEELRTEDENGRVSILRTIKGISKLYDVSAVSIPANNGTSIGVSTRSKIDGAIEAIRAERREAEKLALEKRRAEVRAKALTGREVNK